MTLKNVHNHLFKINLLPFPDSWSPTDAVPKMSLLQHGSTMTAVPRECPCPGLATGCLFMGVCSLSGLFCPLTSQECVSNPSHCWFLS